MWRSSFSQYSSEESVYFESLMHSIRQNVDLQKKAFQVLEQTGQKEPLLLESYRTPQSPTFHGEGPFLFDHLQLILQTLFAIAEGSVSLLSIEEFRSLKGYEGEIQELEETIRENVAFFEVFALCHDTAKWSTITFSTKEGSRGEAIGLSLSQKQHWEEQGHQEQIKMRERYLELYRRFEEEHHGETPEQIQFGFYLSYGIDVHYPGHDRAIHSPVYHGLLECMATLYHLPEQDIHYLEDLIAHHLDPLQDFTHVRPERIAKYYHFARTRGYDADDYLDRLQAITLLDGVCGSIHTGAHGSWQEFMLIQNFFRSEHNFLPSRREEKQKHREEDEKKVLNRYFRETGLDGVALMKLLGSSPGPSFGKILQQIHQAILGKEEMPSFGKTIDQELKERTGNFFQRYF